MNFIKTIFLFLSILSVGLVFGQSRVLKITNKNNNKEIVIKQHKRVRIKTLNGEKLSGRLVFVDADKILIKGKLIHFNEIIKIKRNPLGITIPSSIISGAVVGGVVYLGGRFIGQEISPYIGLLGMGLTFSVFMPPNILKGFKREDHDFKIMVSKKNRI